MPSKVNLNFAGTDQYNLQVARLDSHRKSTGYLSVILTDEQLEELTQRCLLLQENRRRHRSGASAHPYPTPAWVSAGSTEQPPATTSSLDPATSPQGSPRGNP